MAELVERLRESRNNPSVLHIQILHIRSRIGGCRIFVFEGVEDVPVYEEWLGKIASCPTYEPLPAKGKRQVLLLLEQLLKSDAKLLDGTYFFVDRDFDVATAPHDQLHELQVYSIENMLSTSEVLESILRDELRCAGDLQTKSKIQGCFASFQAALLKHCEAVDLRLFAAVRSKRKVVTKPEKISQIVIIGIESAEPSYEDIDTLITVEPAFAEEELKTIGVDFEELPIFLKHRGKYQLEAFRKWLGLVADDLKSTAPKYFPKQVAAAGDPRAASLRRFASGTKPPQTLVDFCNRHFNGAVGQPLTPAL